jgi:hypothetical protein
MPVCDIWERHTVQQTNAVWPNTLDRIVNIDGAAALARQERESELLELLGGAIDIGLDHFGDLVAALAAPGNMATVCPGIPRRRAEELAIRVASCEWRGKS